MPADKVDQLDLDLAASLSRFVATPEADGYEARLGKLVAQQDELLATARSPKKAHGCKSGSPSARTPGQDGGLSGFFDTASSGGSVAERCKADRKRRQEMLTSAPLPCVPRPLHERLWQQVEGYRVPVSAKRLREQLRQFMQSRLCSLRVEHGQIVRRYATLAAQPGADLRPSFFESFQAHASWYEGAIQKAAAACIRLEVTPPESPLPAARSPNAAALRSALGSPSRRWDNTREFEAHDDTCTDDMRELLRFRTYEQACERRVRQIMVRLEWLPVSDGRSIAEEVRLRLTEDGVGKGDSGKKKLNTVKLPRHPLTLEEVEEGLSRLAEDFGLENECAASNVKIGCEGPAAESLEALGTQLAMRVKDAFSEMFEAQETRGRWKTYPTALLAGANGNKQPGEELAIERDSFCLVKDAPSRRKRTADKSGLSILFPDLNHDSGADLISGSPRNTAYGSGRDSPDVTPEDELVQWILTPPSWSLVPGHQAWLKRIGEVDTGLGAEFEFLSVSSPEEATIRIQELAKQHNRTAANAGMEQLKQLFLQTPKVAAAAQKVRESSDSRPVTPNGRPITPNGRPITPIGRPRSSKPHQEPEHDPSSRPRTPGKRGEPTRPLSARVRAETVQNYKPPKPSKIKGDGSGSRPMSPAESTAAEAVEEAPAEGLKQGIPSRKLETLYSLQLLKSRKLRLRLLHSFNVLHSVQKRLAEDFRQECKPEAERAAAVQAQIQELVGKFVASTSSPEPFDDLPRGSVRISEFHEAEPRGFGGETSGRSSRPGLDPAQTRGARNSGAVFDSVGSRSGKMSGLISDVGLSGSRADSHSRTKSRSSHRVADGEAPHRSDVSHRYADASDAEDDDVIGGRKASATARSTRRSTGRASNRGEAFESRSGSSAGQHPVEKVFDGWFDVCKFDDVLGCRVVRDTRGIAVVYSGSLERFEELEREILQIATGAIQQAMERLEGTPADMAADLRAFDRRAVLGEFLELEVDYMSAKVDLVLSLLASYEDALSCPDGAARLRGEILGVIAQRPSFTSESLGQEGSFCQVYEAETAILQRSLQIATSVREAQAEREKTLRATCFQEGYQDSPSVGLPGPLPDTAAVASGVPIPSASLVGDVIRATRNVVETMAQQLEMGDCERALRALRALILQRVLEMWDGLAEELRIRKGLTPRYEAPSFTANAQPEHLLESLVMDNPVSLDAIVTSATNGPDSPSLSDCDQFDRVCMTPTNLSPDVRHRFPVAHQSFEAVGGRSRAATEPHLGGFGAAEASFEWGRPSSASVASPRPPLTRSGSTVVDSLAVNASQSVFSPGPASYHGELAPTTGADALMRGIEIQRLRRGLVGALQESEVLEGVYAAQAAALGVSVDGIGLEALLIQDGMGVAGKPQRVLRDLEGETRMPPEDPQAKVEITIRGPRPAIAELDLDLLEIDFHTPAGVQALLSSADGASKVRLSLQAQLAHNAALFVALRNNGILLDRIRRAVHHKRESSLRKNGMEAVGDQVGSVKRDSGWGDFEATLEAKQQLLVSPSKGWKEKGPVGLRSDQEEALKSYREMLTQGLGDLFLSVNKVKNHVRIGILESYNRKLQAAMQRKGVGANLRQAKADLKAELIEEYVRSVFQELAPFCRASELADQMGRLGRLLYGVGQTGEGGSPGTSHVPYSGTSHPVFANQALLQQAALDFQSLYPWSEMGLAASRVESDLGGQAAGQLETGPLLVRTASLTADRSEEFGQQDAVLQGHGRFGLHLLDENGKIAQVWACYSPLEALRLAAVRGLGVSEIGEGADAVGALADKLRIRWALISMALPKIEPAGFKKLGGSGAALAAAVRDVALAAAQKCRTVFWQELSALKEETEHVRLKSGGSAAVSFLQLKRTIAYWRHVLVLQNSRDQFVKAGKENTAKEAANLLRMSAVVTERPGQDERLPGHIGAFLRELKEDALGGLCPRVGSWSLAEFVAMKGTVTLEVPRPSSRKGSAAREVKPSYPSVDTWLMSAVLPTRFLMLSSLPEEERRLIVAEDKKLEHSLETALADDRGYAQTLPTRVTTKLAYHLELRLIHAHIKSAALDGEVALSDAREGKREPSDRDFETMTSASKPRVSEVTSAPDPVTNRAEYFQEQLRLRLPGWFQRDPVLTSDGNLADHGVRAELFVKMVVKPLGDVMFASAKTMESAKEGGGRLIVRPPAAATKELSSMEAEVWKLKHLIDRQLLEATALSLEAHCSLLLRGRGRREHRPHDTVFDAQSAAAEFVRELGTLGVFEAEEDPLMKGVITVQDEEDGGKEGKVREAAEVFVGRLQSQARRHEELVQAAVYARTRELSRSLLAQQEERALVEWERQMEKRQHTALMEAEICDRGLGMVTELDFLRRKLARTDAHLDDYAQRTRADVEAESAEKVSRLEKEVAVHKSNSEAMRQEMNNEMLQAFADIKNETVLKIMSYQREENHVGGGPGASASVSPQIRMLQMEAELQAQRAENADLRASVTKISAMSRLRLMALSSKFRASLRAVRKERTVLDLEAWDKRERVESDTRALKEQLAAARGALARSEEELRRCTKDLAHVKRTKSRLLSWKVQNSRALDTLEQHDTRVARHVEAKQTAKMQRLYTMASALSGERPPGVEELEAEIERLVQRLAEEKVLRRRAEEQLLSRETSAMEAEKDGIALREETLSENIPHPDQQSMRRLANGTSVCQTPPSKPGTSSGSSSAQAALDKLVPGLTPRSTNDPAQFLPATSQPQAKLDRTEDESPETVASPRKITYGQTASISRPKLELGSPSIARTRAGTAPTAGMKSSGETVQWSFSPSSLTKGAPWQYLHSSRPQSAVEAKTGKDKRRQAGTADRPQRPLTAVVAGRKLQ